MDEIKKEAIQKYHPEDLDPTTTHKMALLIKDTFKEIADLYAEDSVFKKQVEGDLEKEIGDKDKPYVFYVIRDNTQQEIIGCLRSEILENRQITKGFGSVLGTVFFSKYLAVKPEYRKRSSGGLSRNELPSGLLKQQLEHDAIERMKKDDRATSIESRVLETNTKSIEFNKDQGYIPHIETVGGEKTGYIVYFRDYFPENFKEVGDEHQENDKEKK